METLIIFALVAAVDLQLSVPVLKDGIKTMYSYYVPSSFSTPEPSDQYIWLPTTTPPAHDQVEYSEPDLNGNTTRNITACRNKDIKLHVPTRIDASENSVTWILPTGANVFVSDPQTITVHNATENSEGIYRCIRPRADGTFVDEINLSVADCPHKVQLTRIAGAYVMAAPVYLDDSAYFHSPEGNGGKQIAPILHSPEALGSSVELRCSVDAPTAELYWLDGQKKLPYKTNTKTGSISITVDPIGPRTCGNYTCVAVLKGCFFAEYDNICMVEAGIELYLQEFDVQQWNDYESEFPYYNKLQ